MVTQSMQRFLSPVFPILFMVIALSSCGDIDDQGSVSHDGANLAIDFPVPQILTASAINSLQAEATIDGGSSYTLAVDPVTNRISGTITGVSSGTHDLVITYFKDYSGVDVVLCRYSTQVTVNPGQSTTVEILDTDLDRNFDNDQDGWTNLAEVRIGTDPRDGVDVPPGESPLVACGNGTTERVSSANFNLTVIVGSSVSGTASSTNYKVIASFGGYE